METINKIARALVFLIIIVVLSGIGGAYVDRKFFREDHIVIKKVKEEVPVIKYRYRETPKDLFVLQKCYESPIKIELYPGKVEDGRFKMRALAFDMCKETDQNFEFSVSESGSMKYKLILGGIGTAAVAYGVYRYKHR